MRDRQGGVARKRAATFIWACVFASLGTAASLRAAESSFVAVGTHGMVASDCPYASQAGCEVLQAGGNAVDAAVATSLALSVTRSFSMGLGGGGFMMVRKVDGQVFVLDYRESAPAASTADMYTKARAKAPDGPAPSQYGGLAAGVPGLLAGHKAVLERLGTRPLSVLAASAHKLAADGFAIDKSYVHAANAVRADLAKYPSLNATTKTWQHTFLPPEGQLTPGTIIKQPGLAAALELIAEQGTDAFYHGQIANDLAATVQKAGGIMTVEDLAAYRPIWREPLQIRYRDRYDVLLMPPPSSGGVAIAEMLNILEQWDMADVRRRDPGLAAHLTVEAMKHAFADRARLLGDADFAKVPVARLIGKEHGRQLAARIHEDRVSQPDDYGWIPGDDAGTSHYCVVDRWGNVVSATETINTLWGCLVVVEPWGITLNNEMDDFQAEPGRSNAYNLQQSEANAVAPHKRPLSSMSPTIVVEDGRPVLAVGASGGPRIITATLQALMNVVDYWMTVGPAVASPRLHHQWQPNEVYRNSFPADGPVVKGLLARGHIVSGTSKEAIVQAITIEPARLSGASDPRKGGKPAGY